MRKLLVVITSLILTMLIFSTNTYAKSVLKRIEPEMASSKSVAMALETYDGSFYDLNEFTMVRKSRGNVKDILKKGLVKLKTGQDVDVNSIRYFFIQSKNTAQRFPTKASGIMKRPSEEE